MKYFRYLLVLSVLLAGQACAGAVQQISLVNPKAAEWLKKERAEPNLKAIKTQVAAIQQARRDKLKALQAKVPQLNRDFLKETPHINFTDIRIQDAIYMLDEVKRTPRIMLYILDGLRSAALEATDASMSTSDREHLDQQLQANKAFIDWMQTLSVINGDKQLGGGNLEVSFGTGDAKNAVWTLNLPAIDNQSLGLTPLNFLSDSAALQAVTVIDKAIETVEAYKSGASELAVTDMEIMLLDKPNFLYTNFKLLVGAHHLAAEATDPALSDKARKKLDGQFNYLIQEMQSLQTFWSYSGPIPIGGGKITLQVSNSASLEIDLPIGDPNLLGIDKLNIRTVATAEDALLKLKDHLKNFVYY